MEPPNARNGRRISQAVEIREQSISRRTALHGSAKLQPPHDRTGTRSESGFARRVPVVAFAAVSALPLALSVLALFVRSAWAENYLRWYH